MFDSISKVWNEVSETSEEHAHSVRFSPSTRLASSIHNNNNNNTSTTSRRYLQPDKPRGSILKNPLDRVRRAEAPPLKVRGSPRILKPTSDARQQKLSSQGNKAVGLWGALGKLGKVFKGDDSEIGSMKDYMNGMISRDGDGAGVKRPNDLAKSRLESIKHRAQLVNQRAARFTSENVSPEKKRQRTMSLKNEQIRRIELKELEDLESSRDHIVDKIQRRRQPSKTTLIATSGLKFNINDIPSSPMRGSTEPVASGTPLPVIYNDTTMDSVNISQSTLNQLTQKLQLLENTVESLKEELKLSNERSQHLEVSLNEVKREQEIIDNTILKSEEMEKIGIYEPVSRRELGPYESNSGKESTKREKRVHLEEIQDEDEAVDDEFEDVNRSLSPVKLDLHKFKYIE